MGNYRRSDATAAADLEDGDPGQSDVVKRDGAVERIATGRLADLVVFVPVDAAADRVGTGLVADEQCAGGWPRRQWTVNGMRHCRLVTAQAAVNERRYLTAFRHAAVGRATADEIAPVLADVIVDQIEPATEQTPVGDNS